MSKYLVIGIIVGLFALLSFGLLFGKNAGFGNQTNQSTNTKRIITSFYPLYFFTTRIVADVIEVRNITPAGAEPHDYEPTAKEIAQIEKSNLLLLNGGKLESWGDKVKEEVSKADVKILTVGDNLLSRENDPHIWLSPVLAKKIVQKIATEVEQLFFENRILFDRNAEELEKDLDQLDHEYREGLKNCKKKDIVTSHAAFGYLADDYGLRLVSISGISPDEEPSSADLSKIVQFVKNNKIQYIFFESLVSPKLSETIAYETGAQTLVLDPIEGLSDEEIVQGKSYLTKMRDNLKNLQKALECT